MKKYLREKTRDLFWQIYGKRLKNPEIPKNIDSILFICKGNICRSPFAEHMGSKILKEKGIDHIKCYSAGLVVGNSVSPPKEAILAAQNFGIDLKGHKSKRVESDIVQKGSIIFTMEMKDFNSFRDKFPYLKEKLFLLPLFKKDSDHSRDSFLRYNITDPYGKDFNSFINCYQRIKECLVKFFDDYLLTPGSKK